MNNTLIDRYMDYKSECLLNYGLVPTVKTNEFYLDHLKKYLKTYINCYYYHYFETVYTKEYTNDILKEEIEGKRLEFLAELSERELSVSNEEYNHEKKTINVLAKLTIFLIRLDHLRFKDKDEIETKVTELIESLPRIKELYHDNYNKLISLVTDNYLNLTNFFEKKDKYYSVEYLLFKDREQYVQAILSNNIKVLQDNYKKTLVDRVYKENKFQADKTFLLIKKFIKELLYNNYYKIKVYQRYFIEIPAPVFNNKKDLEKVFNMLNNPFLKRFICLIIDDDSYHSNQAFIKKYHFSIACKVDFSHINDVPTKLTNLDNSKKFDYIIVEDFKDRDYEIFNEFSKVNLLDILFKVEV